MKSIRLSLAENTERPSSIDRLGRQIQLTLRQQINGFHFIPSKLTKLQSAHNKLENDMKSFRFEEQSAKNERNAKEQQIQKELQAQQNQCRQLNKDWTSLFSYKTKYQEENLRILRKIKSLDSQAIVYRNLIEEGQSTKKEILEEQKGIKKSIEELKLQNDLLENHLIDKKGKLSTFTRQIELMQANIQKSKDIISSNEKKLSKKKDENMEINSQIISSAATKQKIRTQITAIKSNIDQQIQQISKLSSLQREFKQKIFNISNKIEEENQIDIEYSMHYSQMCTRNQSLQATKKEISNQIQKLEDNCLQQTNKINQNSKLKQSCRQYLNELIQNGNILLFELQKCYLMDQKDGSIIKHSILFAKQ